MPSFKTPTEPDFHRFDKRFRLWGGVNKTRDPAAIGDNQLVEGINIRPTVDGYKERPGLERWTTFPVSGTIEGIHEAGDIGAPATSFFPPAGVVIPTGPFAGYIGTGITASNGEMYVPFSDGTNLRIYRLGSSGSGRQHVIDTNYLANFHVDSIGLSAYTTPVITLMDSFALPTAGWVTSIAEAGGQFFIFLNPAAGAADAEAYIWDPVAHTLTLDEAFAGRQDSGYLFTVDGTSEVMWCAHAEGADSGGQWVRKTDTTWNALARSGYGENLMGLTYAKLGANHYYGGFARHYLAADAPSIIKWDGNTATLLTTMPLDLRFSITGVAIGGNPAVHAMKAHEGYIYYVWNASLAPSYPVFPQLDEATNALLRGCYIGRSDGTTWTSKWVDLSTTLRSYHTGANPRVAPFGLEVMNSMLVVWCMSDFGVGGSGQEGILVILVNLDGTINSSIPFSPGTPGSVSHLFHWDDLNTVHPGKQTGRTVLVSP